MRNHLLVLLLIGSIFFSACTSQSEKDAINPSEPAPTVNFSFQENSTGDVTFATTTTGKITSYSWSFGDQETSGDVNPIHSYNRNKTHSVSLKVKGPGGEATTSKLVEVKNVEGFAILWTTKLYPSNDPSIDGTVVTVRQVETDKYIGGMYISKTFSSAPSCGTAGTLTVKAKDGDYVKWYSNGSSSEHDFAKALRGNFTIVGRECKNVRIE